MKERPRQRAYFSIGNTHVSIPLDGPAKTPTVSKIETREGPRVEVVVQFPRWLLDALPQVNSTRILTGAVIVGSKMDTSLVRMGQVSVAQPGVIRTLFFLKHEYEQLFVFGRQIHVASQCAMIRTAVHLALGIPGVHEGVITPPHHGYTVPEETCENVMLHGNTMSLFDRGTLIQKLNHPALKQDAIDNESYPLWLRLSLKSKRLKRLSTLQTTEANHGS